MDINEVQNSAYWDFVCKNKIHNIVLLENLDKVIIYLILKITRKNYIISNNYKN